MSRKHNCRDTESMMPEIPDPKLTELGPESSGGTPADKGESSCAADELFTEPFQVCSLTQPEQNLGEELPMLVLANFGLLLSSIYSLQTGVLASSRLTSRMMRTC